MDPIHQIRAWTGQCSLGAFLSLSAVAAYATIMLS